MKVAVVSIMKNEEQFIKRWADSCKDADYRILLDTGSTDNSIAVAKDNGVIVHETVINPWHFAKARNHLLDLIPEDVDWIVNLDCDEVFGKGWRKALEVVPRDGSVNRPRYCYVWNWESKVTRNGIVDIEGTIAEGKPGLQYHGDKITQRFSHRWVNAVHEVNVTQPPYEERQSVCDVRIYHFADDTKSRGSYLPLLLQDVADNPENDRNTYYAARELMYYGRTEESIALFKRHLTMASSQWPPERGFSCRYLGRQVPPDQKEHWFLKAVAEYPWGRETWLELAQHYYNVSDWNGCYWAAGRCLSLTDRGQLYLTEPASWGFMPHDLYALSAYHTKRYDVAIEHGTIALGLEPNDQRLKDNLAFYKLAVAKADVIIPYKSNASGLTTLVGQLMQDEKVGKIIVVGDGYSRTHTILETLPPQVIKLYVEPEVGIHAMWNLGMTFVTPGNHVCFINDDVTLGTRAMTGLITELAQSPAIGLACPNYDKRHNQGWYELTSTTCRGRYDGTGGMAGFCMMLASDLCHYRFDERMKWWYGDDLLVDWVNNQDRLAVISDKATCQHHHSKTIDNDPPSNFAIIVANDKRIYEETKEQYAPSSL